MKRFLRVGERYALTKHKRKQYTIKYFSLLAAATIMCLEAVQQVSAQVAEPAVTAIQIDKIEPLQIGDTVPEYLWHLPLQVVNHPDGGEVVRLNDYRDKKLVILEFWGSRCPPCIEAVDEIHQLKDEFSEELAALPVLTRSKLEEGTIPFMQKRGWTLPSVVNDTILDREVFSRYLPDWGDVWLYEGRLLAVPKRGYVNRETVQAVLEGKAVNFINRHNVHPIDPLQPIFKRAATQSAGGRIGGYLPDYETQRIVALNRGDSTILYGWNLPLEQLYFDAYQHEIHPHLNEKTGIQWSISDTLYKRLFAPRLHTNAIERVVEGENWRKRNLFGYEQRKEVATNDAFRSMQKDLNEYFGEIFGLEASIQHISHQKYAVLRTLDGRKKSELLLTGADTIRRVRNTDERWAYDNYPTGHLHLHIEEALRRIPNLALTIGRLVDSTGISRDFRVSFEFPKSIRDGGDMNAIQQVLHKYGLYLTIEEKAVPVLVVRQRDKMVQQDFQ